MLPHKDLNIYPKSDENLRALIGYYFDKYDIDQTNGVELLKNKTSLNLNQIEFILKKLSEAYAPVFQKHLKGEIKFSNLLKYGFDALTGSNVAGSKNRELITAEFNQFVIQNGQ